MPAATEGGARTLPVRSVVRAGLVAGLGGGAAAAGTLMAIGEIAAAPTARPGIRSSTWTAPTAIASLVFGDGAYHGSFAVLPILAGLALLALVSAALGVLGAALIAVVLGPRPGPVGALVVGALYGLCLEVVGVNVVVNVVQSPNTIYEAVPSWAWWLALGSYGVVLGLVCARRARAPLAGVSPTAARQALA